MKSFYSILLFLGLPLWLSAQTTGQNYIIATIPFQPVTDPTALVDANSNPNSNSTIQYFDGLGRPVETVQKALSSKDGTTWVDLVNMTQYDAFGREYKHLLPAPATGNTGAFVDSTGFAGLSSTQYAGEKPYSTTEFEPSPLNRVTGQYGAGKDWYDASKKVNTAYQANDANEVVYFSVENDQLKRNGNYDSGTLYKTVVTDEDGKPSTEYKDKQGQVVLKRSEEGGQHVDTYFVYNDLGKLSYVIPPKAVDEMTSDLGDDNAIIKQYCYLYKYDERGNNIQKRLPGCDYIYMVYDKAYRLVLSQDGNQRTKKQQDKKQWTATKYDALGRVIFTGTTYVDSTKTVQSLNTDYSTQLITENYTVGTGYSNQFFADASPLTINYYDGYDFINLLSVDADKSTLPFVALDGYDSQFSSAKGLLTGNRIYHLDDPAKFEATALYYDKYGRVVQSRASNHLGGYDLVYNALDFLSKPTKTYKTHGINGTTASITELYAYTYDKAQRLTVTMYSLNGGSSVILASNTYDELGRLVTKKRHTSADTETYAYNIRNWFTTINSGGFTESLYYNANPLNSNACFNGNISYSTWTYNGATKGYLYDYDGLNRLLSASFKEESSGLGDDSFNENFTYDKMGNILTLKRKKNYIPIDDLVFHYSNNEKSNQLQYVDDGGITQGQYLIKEYQNKSNTQAEFEYDANGNMKKDLDRDIATIQYNMLNLPDVVQFKNGNQIKNSYNAGGQKLGTEYFTWRPGANAPVVNIGDVLSISYSQGAIDQNGTAYIGNIEYNTQNGNSSLTALNRIHNTEGYVENISSPNYYYYRKDHLGNNREVWLANTNSTVQKTQYYPSGLPWATTWDDNLSTQPYKYNAKEFVEMHGYDTYDYGWRGYYPALGSFTTVDPLAEKYPNISSYVYCVNNPVKYIDPDGRDWFQNEKTGSVYYNTKMRKDDIGKGGMKGDGWKWMGANEMFNTDGAQCGKSDLSLVAKNGGKIAGDNYDVNGNPTTLSGEMMLNGGGSAEKFMSNLGYQKQPIEVVEYTKENTIRSYGPGAKGINWTYGDKIQINEKFQYLPDDYEEITRSNMGPFLFTYNPITGSERVERKNVKYSDNVFLQSAQGIVDFISAMNGTHKDFNKSQVYDFYKPYTGGVNLLNKYLKNGKK